MLGDNKKLFVGGAFSSPAIFFLPCGKRVVRGIFDDPACAAAPGQQIAETSEPTLYTDFEKVKDIKRETSVTINGGRFSVLEVRPDRGTGMALVVLAHEESDEEEDD